MNSDRSCSQNSVATVPLQPWPGLPRSCQQWATSPPYASRELQNLVILAGSLMVQPSGVASARSPAQSHWRKNFLLLILDSVKSPDMLLFKISCQKIVSNFIWRGRNAQLAAIFGIHVLTMRVVSVRLLTPRWRLRGQSIYRPPWLVIGRTLYAKISHTVMKP